MKGFLSQVSSFVLAQYQGAFKDVRFVFPNQRSVAYFVHELKKEVDKPMWLPRTQTIAEFVSEVSSLQKGSQVALLFALYNEYIKVSGSKESFDDFYHWGEILLNDFDDVDKYLADPKGVFLNVKDFKTFDKKIDFLTEEQLGVLKTFFDSFDAEKYSLLQNSFMEIWEVLLPVYYAFNESLRVQNIAYEGAVYRKAASCVNDAIAANEHIVFVGFNAITKCEEQIFSSLQKKRKASFFWDYDSYYLNDDLQEAGMFIRKYLKMFPMPEGFELQSKILDVKRQVNICSAPTNYGQIDWVGQSIANVPTQEMDKTALVLADEGLLFSVINNLPDNVLTLNTTMGYPIIESNVGLLVDLVLQLQQNVRISSSGELSFYYKYVLRLLGHPLVKLFDEAKGQAVCEEIVSANLFNVPKKMLEGVFVWECLFVKAEDIYEYLNVVLMFFMNSMLELTNNEQDSNLDMEFLFAAIKVNNQFDDELRSSKVLLKQETYSGLFMKVLKAQKVPFEGEPLKGLQLMGFLETRNLDFDRVYVVSVNEGLLPSGQHKSSFIPYSLRRGFSLPTTEMHDAMYAYYFYRLLQRSKEVNLIYNSGSSGMQSGEKSRFIYQLLYGEQFNAQELVSEQGLELKLRKEQRVEKTQEVQKLLEEYLTEGTLRKLTPSALTRYLQCSLRFYYHSVLRLYENDEIEEQVDARLFGNLFHTAAEYLYTSASQSKALIDRSFVAELKQKSVIDRSIQFAFNEVFKVKKGQKFAILGKNELVQSVLFDYLYQMLEKDLEVTPFSMVGLEQELYWDMEFDVAGKKRKVKLGGVVDRLDKNEKTVRIVDYKTGGDKLSFRMLDDVFDPDKVSDHKAVFQTFVYALVYALNYPDESFIEPLVYQVKSFFIPSSDFKIKSKAEPDFLSGNFKSIQSRVNEKLTAILEEIFNPDVPFVETTQEKQCIYCPYKMMCGK